MTIKELQQETILSALNEARSCLEVLLGDAQVQSQIVESANMMIACLKAGGKIISC
jgi:phosphoheptose isomerase